jgi:energy-coupling factor transporter ATP-binding protein EcfA2
MKVYNAGLENIEFGFNQNLNVATGSLTKSQIKASIGGYYSVDPGEYEEVPEGFRTELLVTGIGPGHRGLIIVDGSKDFDEQKLEGMRKYVEFCQQRAENQLIRQTEEEEVGRKRVRPLPMLVEYQKLAEKAFDALEAMERGDDGDITGDGGQGSQESGGQDGHRESEVQPGAN